MRKILSFACVVAAACGGSKGPVAEPTPPGETHAAPAPEASATDAGPQAPAAPETSTEPAPPPAAVTFELKNEGETDVTFGVTKGWGPVLFAYTGKPPKAKSVILFESACSASCDAPADQLCPVCPEPTTRKEEEAMAKSETATPGGTVKVPWDGKVLVYQKAPGKKRCKCWRKEDPPAGTYTIKACGIRRAKKVGKAPRPECTQADVALGPNEATPRSISLSFK